MTTEAPVSTDARKTAWTPERRAEMSRKTKERMAAAKALKPSEPAVDPRDARIAELEAKLAAKPAPAPSIGPASQQIASKTATVAIECVYRYKPKGGWKAVATAGHNVIDSYDDPRWEGELMEAPYNGSVRGALEVAEVTRLDGKILSSVDICGGPVHMNEARNFIRQFTERAKAGEERPWDTERFHRDELARAEKAKREGRLEELAAIREMFLAASQGGREFVLVKS